MRKFAILVGVNHYEDPAIRDLAYAGRDAVALGESLRATCGFDEVQVYAGETGRPCSPKDLYRRVLALADVVQEEDVFLFFFAGHGAFCDGQTYFLTGAAETIDYAADSISLRRLRSKAAALKARTRILIADACRNEPENEPEAGGRSLPRPGGGAARDIALRPRAAPEAMPPATWYSLFACSAGERSFECDQSRHGVFTRFLLEGLDGRARNRDGDVTLNSLNQYVARAVIDWCVARGKPLQRPYAVTDGTPADFVLVPARGPRNVLVSGAAAKGAPVAGRPWRVEPGPGAALDFAWCPAGSFRMGRLGDPIAEPPHAVSLPEGFWMADAPVTQRQWKAVMGSTVRDLAERALADPASLAMAPGATADALLFGRDPEGDGDLPALYASWEDAAAFCRRLTLAQRDAGLLPADLAYRLPTEAEWEYACRAGTQADLYSGEDLQAAGPYDAPRLGALAWYGGNSCEGLSGPGCDVSSLLGGQRRGAAAFARPVKALRPNGLGLYDMLGNVWEWCLDDYNAYPALEQTDPLCRTPRGLPRKVIRGGGWHSKAASCTCHSRSRQIPAMRHFDLGFRVALGRARTVDDAAAPPPRPARPC